ncbi:hypothetical protein NFI96_007678 [Prochilodus magdalenae]|nr:hypothetical protein NFI96_007678 [Prochilodus magdalenae]
MDTKEITRHAVQIEKLQKEGNYEDVSCLLADLNRSTVTLEQLQTTDIAKTVYQLSKSCPAATVRKAAKGLLSKWKRLYGSHQHKTDTDRQLKERKPPEEGPTSPPAKRECCTLKMVDSMVSTPKKHDGDEDSKTVSVVPPQPRSSTDSPALRTKCIELLLQALSPSQKTDNEDTSQLSTIAQAIEQHIHAVHGQNQAKYKSSIRSRLANLRNPKNPHLRHGLLTGTLEPAVFARMSVEEMAGEELRKLRESYTAEAISEHQLPQRLEGTTTTKVRCQRCQGMDCRVTQVPRGTLFLPSWVRGGNADEDAMTFMTCVGCGEQWFVVCPPGIFLIMSSKSSLLKVILLGDGGVGKSSLMNRYVSNKFDSHLFHTIGVEFLNKELEVDGRQVTLQIWDTAGQERFRSLRTPFYRGSDCCLLTFSVDDSQSFLNLSHWRKEFAYYADVKEPDNFPFVILGNKVDVTERQVATEEAQRWCHENGGHPYFETSAKDATNVAEAFEEVVSLKLRSKGTLTVKGF